MIKRIHIFLKIILLFLVLIACNTMTQQRLNCICLIDFSGSLSDQTLQNYISIISYKIMMNLGEKDRLVVLPIDEGAKTEAVKLIYEDFSEQKFSFATDGFTHAHDSAIARIQKFVQEEAPLIEMELKKQKELRLKYTYHTDILSALEQSSTMLEKNEDDSFIRSLSRFFSGDIKLIPENMIVVFSDMIHETSEINFNRLKGCTPDEAKRIIAELIKNDKIPILHGCKIFINGRTGHSNIQVENIKNFWMEYFKLTQGDLLAYDYDSSQEISSYLQRRMSKIK